MGFTRKKFIELSEHNRLKKILFKLNENLGHQLMPELAEWIGWNNELFPDLILETPQSAYDMQILREKLIQKLGLESEYTQDQLLDDSGKIREIFPITVLLDNLRSPHNAGSIIRSCEAFGVESMIFCGITPNPDHPKVRRTAMNSPVEWSCSESVFEPIDVYRKNGYRLLAIEKSKNSIPLQELEVMDRVLMILGNEEFGLDSPVLNACDQIVHIDLKGIKNSINVSVAAGIVLHHLIQIIRNTADKN